MAITYPLFPPTDAAGIESFKLTSITAVGVLRSPFTFATQTQRHQGQAWAAEVGLAPCLEADAEPWIAFLLKLNGPHGTFMLGDPWHRSPLGLGAGDPEVSGDHAAGSPTLATIGWPANTPKVLKAGDYFQVGERLHKVLTDANTDALGHVILDIFPTLRAFTSTTTPIITESPKGLFRLAESEATLMEIDKERVYSISFTAMEAV